MCRRLIIIKTTNWIFNTSKHANCKLIFLEKTLQTCTLDRNNFLFPNSILDEFTSTLIWMEGIWHIDTALTRNLLFWEPTAIERCVLSIFRRWPLTQQTSGLRTHWLRHSFLLAGCQTSSFWWLPTLSTSTASSRQSSSWCRVLAHWPKTGDITLLSWWANCILTPAFTQGFWKMCLCLGKCILPRSTRASQFILGIANFDCEKNKMRKKTHHVTKNVFSGENCAKMHVYASNT